jgi:hypothetical protein
VIKPYPESKPIFTLILGFILMIGCNASSGERVRLTPTPLPPKIEVILTGLDNPRGVVVGPAGELFVAEAGTGYDAVDPTRLTGKFTKFTDLNGDRDFDDEAEIEPWFSQMPTYNALQFFGTGRDEVNGPGDVLLHQDGRLFLTLDGGFEDLALFEISPEGVKGRSLAGRSNMNSIAFALDQERIYAVESTLNQLIEVTLAGELREIVVFPLLDSGQQAVPAGLTVDFRTNEILVALFSGAVVGDQTEEVIPFVAGDSKIVRVDPESGQMTEEITGLTTAVDVAMDEAGNIIVVELASGYADTLPRLFDLFDADAPPLHGGYLRYSGRVTLYPAASGLPRVLAEGLDEPTNVTIGPDGALYVSTGQGTPGRPIPGPNGPTQIVGQIIRITYEVFANDEQ